MESTQPLPPRPKLKSMISVNSRYTTHAAQYSSIGAWPTTGSWQESVGTIKSKQPTQMNQAASRRHSLDKPDDWIAELRSEFEHIVTSFSDVKELLSVSPSCRLGFPLCKASLLCLFLSKKIFEHLNIKTFWFVRQSKQMLWEEVEEAWVSAHFLRCSE